MKKIILIFIIFFTFWKITFAEIKLENGSQEIVKKYNFSTKNLEKSMTKKEFLETLEKWYPDYKGKKLDKNIFLEKDLEKILERKEFFEIMKKLWVFSSLQNCKNLKICDKEETEKSPFNKAIYYKYISKILDKNKRKYFKTAKQYLEIWYKPFLKPSYKFPLQKQTLNGCYAFSVKNILKYKNNLDINVPKTEKIIWKKWENLWNPFTILAFNNATKVEMELFYDIDTLINSLQNWEIVAITYNLKYFSQKEKKEKTVPHIVAAYSFDEKWVWVAETVSNSRKNIAWEEIFDKNGKVKVNRIFRFNYKEKKFWSENEKIFEEKNNVLKGEF